MLKVVHPKLPMRDASVTRAFYTQQLGFTMGGDYGDYLILRRDNIEVHFFLFPDLNPFENYGQIYVRTDDIETLFQSIQNKEVKIVTTLSQKPWGQKEFSLIDPDHNLWTFGETLR